MAVWTPISEGGQSCLSRAITTALRRGELVTIEVEVFSASMYIREMLEAGSTHLRTNSPDMEAALAALGAVVEVQGPDGKTTYLLQP